MGVTALLARGQYPYEYWYWIGVGALVVLTILYNIGFTLALTFMPGNTPSFHILRLQFSYYDQ